MTNLQTAYEWQHRARKHFVKMLAKQARELRRAIKRYDAMIADGKQAAAHKSVMSRLAAVKTTKTRKLEHLEQYRVSLTAAFIALQKQQARAPRKMIHHR